MELDDIVQQSNARVRPWLDRRNAAMCFAAQFPPIADRVVLLSPSELLGLGHSGREPKRRDGLPERYRSSAPDGVPLARTA
ncbi:MAG: hypothetical protein IT307_20580 [Chloroflexi bacterium]|nr:hypothetical protein [Chloroflexota bacterium]